MPPKQLDRADAIAQLINYVTHSIDRPADSDWLQLTLRRGFAGFERMTDAQLLRELELRELLPASEELTEIDEEPDDAWAPALFNSEMKDYMERGADSD